MSVASQAEEGFSFASLKRMATELASVQHQPPKRVSEPFLKVDYDGYRMIAARHENALWRDVNLPFFAEFFSAGYIYEYPVEINTVDSTGKVTALSYGPQWFQFRGAMEPLGNTPGGGFSGFRLLAQMGANPEKVEFLVFQGASYFRGRGSEQVYGSSARGLAVDVGLPSPEEFPRFTKFWIEQPTQDAKQTRVWALLDGPAEAGAYEFTITPGKELAIDVQAELWYRHGVQKVGIAPLTSMWMWDANNTPAGDFRPDVHDADGLLIQEGTDTWTWRPLRRPKAAQVSQWPVRDLRGFGLLQRDRNFEHYRDAEAKYHQRPSMWVTPTGDWGPGRVELLELPSETEGGDNIGAYWVGSEPFAAHSHRTLKYRLTFGDGPTDHQQDLQVVDTRISAAGDITNFELEFAGATKLASAEGLSPKVTCDAGTIENISSALGSDGHVLLRFGFRPADVEKSNLQAQLGTGTAPVSEKWSYLWTRK
jgi:glucans biosynthesis protein